MNNFSALHPALQHHIVNSLGWRELRDELHPGMQIILNYHLYRLIFPVSALGKIRR